MTEILITILAISLIFPIIGCFILWKRYAHFSDGLGHSSMLAAAISLVYGINSLYVGFVVAACFAIIVFDLTRRFKHFAGDGNVAIAFTSSAMMAMATIIASLSTKHVHLECMFFGNIESIGMQDITKIVITGALMLYFLIMNFNKLVMIVVSRDIAKAKGINVNTYEFLFLLLMAMVVFSAIKATGGLLVAAMLIMPALIARIFASSPFGMVCLATIFSVLINLSGFMVYNYVGKLLSPLIVVVGVIVFCGCRAVIYLKNLRYNRLNLDKTIAKVANNTELVAESLRACSAPHAAPKKSLHHN